MKNIKIINEKNVYKPKKTLKTIVKFVKLNRGKNMKLLKFKIPYGYKMLDKGFEVNFLTKTRVNKNIENNDLIELEPGLYYPLETTFIGKNSSGKTSVLLLIHLIMTFIRTGRIPTLFMAEQERFALEFVFYDGGYIYLYEGSFSRSKLNDSAFLLIEKESLRKTTFKESHKKDLENVSFLKENLLTPNVGSDTSDIVKYKFNDTSILVDLISQDPSNLATIIDVIKKIYGNDSFNTLVRLFDDSIEMIDSARLDDSSAAFKFKRVNQPEIVVTISYLKERLSSGTYRGIYLFAASLLAFRLGGDILIDEIEKSFNKNLIENLIILFNDKRINKMGASLIYSTHYSELLDHSSRCDNINVLHRNGDVITVNNMCTSYEIRTDLSKSNQFEQNAFDNLTNYDRLMDLRRLLLK